MGHTMTNKLIGSCLCGAVSYESAPLLGPFGHCHCRTCQKAHSAPFITTGPVDLEAFKWTTGEAVVTYFESSPGKRRYFCPKCGTHMIAIYTEQQRATLRIASLDTPIDAKPAGHIWVDDKAWFFDFDDGLPRLPEGVPG